MERVENLLDEVKLYIIELLRVSPFRTDFCYHDLRHIETVVLGVREIGEAEGLSSASIYLLEIAAWFHDVGLYTKGQYEGHEEQGVLEASSFLQSKNLDEYELGLIYSCIRATKMPQKPQSLMQQVMCDADLIHLSKTHFFDSTECLRKEFELREVISQTSLEAWIKMTIQFLQDHHYFTHYGKTVLEANKMLNLTSILEYIR